MSCYDFVVNDKAQDADYQGRRKDDDGEGVFFTAEFVAAVGWCDNRRDTAQGADQYPRKELDVRKTGKVA